MVACLCGSASGAWAAPVGPGQRFDGVVNGRRANGVVKVVCGGPVGPGSTGPVAAGQTVEVVRTATGRGDTGLFSQVYFWVNPPPGGPRPATLTFTTYRTGQEIPTSTQVPCGGSGQVTFSSCPYLAPCAAGWVPETMKVTFENLAV